jgi:hypothetical protein
MKTFPVHPPAKYKTCNPYRPRFPYLFIIAQTPETNNTSTISQLATLLRVHPRRARAYGEELDDALPTCPLGLLRPFWTMLSTDTVFNVPD